MAEKVVPKRQDPKDFKAEAARLRQCVSQRKSACPPWVPIATLGDWVHKQRETQVSRANASNGVATSPRRPVSKLDAKNCRLRNGLADAKLDMEIMQKATAYFVKGSR